MRTIKKILVEKDTGKKYFVKDLKEDFHTAGGVISFQELSSPKETVLSRQEKAFYLFEPAFPDLWESLQRGPQVMLPKDIGLILAKTGANKNYRVVDAGGGSGSLCFHLANICKEVTVYEINPEFYRLLQKNKQLLGFQNITLKREDIYRGMAEKGLDLITLDLPEPWRVIPLAEKALKTGAFMAVYLPNLTQVQQLVRSAAKSRIKVVETVELLERKWKIEERIMRPEFEMLGHTGFLTFCRKL